jgi:hypothetical protein
MAIGRKTGGRQKGTPNKKTRLLKEAADTAMAQINNTLGADAFTGDGVSLLQTIYKSPAFPPEMRMEAASRAAKFERPALSAVDNKIEDKRERVARMPHPSASVDEFMAQYGTQDDKTH